MAGYATLTRPTIYFSGRLSRMCSSRNCFAVTSEGAPIIRSSARWFIGKRTTSRKFSSPHSSMTMRSIPGAMRPCAERQRAQHAAELRFEHVFRIVRDRERLLHHIGAMVADRAGRQLHAVADDVVLNGPQRQQLFTIVGIERQKLFRLDVRHRERVMGEVDLLFLLVPFEHRKVDDPAQFEPVLVDQVQLFTDLGAGEPCEFPEFVGIAGNEEGGVANSQAELPSQSLRAFGTNVSRKRASAIEIFSPESPSLFGLSFAGKLFE